MTSYSRENEAENLQNGDVHLAQIPDFEMEISRTIWSIAIEVGDGSFFFIFHALSFELNFFGKDCKQMFLNMIVVTIAGIDLLQE